MERPLYSNTAGTTDPASATRASSHNDIILWADTFNNYLTPHTAQSALAVLEDAGFRVHVPREHLCCGRPLYDFGMLDQAKRYLRKILTTLAPEIDADMPVVCLEPSCASVFKDELTNLFPHDERAQKLSKLVILFPDFLDKIGYKPRPLHGKAVVHGHCHHKSLWSMSPEQRLLSATGLETTVLDSGCCGLAGSFGYEAGHHDISMQIGNRVLFPAIRDAAPADFIVSDGFSCRQQISHGTERKGMHTAEVLAMALEGTQPTRPRKRRPVEAGHTQPSPGSPLLGIGLAAGILGAGLYLFLRSTAASNDRPRDQQTLP